MNPKLIESMRGTPPPKSTEEAWKEHYRLQEQYIEELENRLRALWDKYEGDRKHYMDRIKRLEELGDAMVRGSRWMGMFKEIERWRKAREDKL